MKKLFVGLLLLLLSPLLVPLFAVAVVFALCVSFYSWLWLIWFCWTHADRVYLICSRRRGWDAFLKNNAIPSLPSHITAVWLESPNRLANVVRAARLGGACLSKPFLILVTPFSIKSSPLNHRLLHLKPFGKRSAPVRADARQVIDDALSDFSQWYRSEVT
jgi:hypothetical protein